MLLTIISKSSIEIEKTSVHINIQKEILSAQKKEHNNYDEEIKGKTICSPQGKLTFKPLVPSNANCNNASDSCT